MLRESLVSMKEVHSSKNRSGLLMGFSKLDFGIHSYTYLYALGQNETRECLCQRKLNSTESFLLLTLIQRDDGNLLLISDAVMLLKAMDGALISLSSLLHLLTRAKE